ncbi:hypothetical protein BKA83DRAFT_4121786 [Pisolithus microcarpus]|nr:hypothetical protein BKA83DRAFT_4121786 [Pisolithus microcarpus]
MASIADEESTAQCVCSCSKYNFGKPHTVSLATWYRHIDEAQTETEKQCIRSARVRQATPHLTGPVSVRGRAATIQAMAKRRIETVEDGNPSHTPDLSHPTQDDEDTLPHTPDLPDPALDNEDTFLHTPDLPHPALDNEDMLPHTPDLPDPAVDNEDTLLHTPNLPDPALDNEDTFLHTPDLPHPALDNECFEFRHVIWLRITTKFGELEFEFEKASSVLLQC